MDWYPRYPAHYDRDTLHLSLAEHGAYCRLIDYYMATENPLPDDERALAGILRCSVDDWKAVATTVRAYFKAKGGKLIHKRCEAELETQIGRRNRIAVRNRKNGQKGGRPKQGDIKEIKPNGFADGNPKEPSETHRQTDRQTDSLFSESPPNPDRSENLHQLAPSRKSAAGAYPLPKDWAPTADQSTHAVNLGLHATRVQQEAEKFRAYWTIGRGNGKRRSDRGWRQTWLNWIGRALERPGATEAPKQPANTVASRLGVTPLGVGG